MRTSGFKVKFNGNGNIHNSKQYQQELVEQRNKMREATNGDRGYARLNVEFDTLYPNETGGIDNSIYRAWMQSELIKLLIEFDLLEGKLMTYSIDVDCDMEGIAKPNKYGYHGTIGVYLYP